METFSFKVQMKRPDSSLNMVKSWFDAAAGVFDTEEEAHAEIAWWQRYDEENHLTGWVYNVLHVKKRK
jgi:hypothetical protein